MINNPVLRVYHRVILESNLYAARALLGLAELIWAISLAWPSDTFSRPTYRGLASIAGEAVWAAVFFIMASFQFSILGMKIIDRKVSFVFSLVNMCFWWFVVISMYISVSAPAAIGGETALAFGASLIFIRAGWGESRGD